MKRYFTSDFHLGSSLINKYAHRPYKDASTALAGLLTNINTKTKRPDVLIHVGDFMLSGADRHGEVEDHGLDLKLDDYISLIKPSIFLLEGNHDTGHNCEAMAKSMWIDLNQNYRHIFVSHFPSYHEFYRGPDCSKWQFGRGIVLCGHVHDSWKVMYDAKKNVLNINVGVDVWDYKPVEDVQITELLDFIKNAKVKMPKDQMTSAEVRIWKKQNECAVIADRAERKAARYAKKGITSEIAEQRRIEAMKAKGLIP